MKNTLFQQSITSVNEYSINSSLLKDMLYLLLVLIVLYILPIFSNTYSSDTNNLFNFINLFNYQKSYNITNLLINNATDKQIHMYSALFSIVGCLSVFLFISKIHGRQFGWVTSITLAVSPLYLILSRNINLYSISSLLATLSLLLIYYCILNGQNIKLCILSGISMGLGLFLDDITAVLMPYAIITTWCIRHNQKDKIKYLFNMKNIFIIFFFVLIKLIYIYTNNIDIYFFSYISKNYIIWQIPILILLGTFPWSIILLLSLSNNNIKNIIAIDENSFLIIWFVSYVVLSVVFKNVSFIVPSLIPLAILSSNILKKFWLSIVPRFIILAFNFISIICLIGLIYVFYFSIVDSILLQSITVLAGIIISNVRLKKYGIHKALNAIIITSIGVNLICVWG